MDFDQREFNFDARGAEEGHRRWREELDERKRNFESRWGAGLGKRVTVWLNDHANPLTGMLEWLNQLSRGIGSMTQHADFLRTHIAQPNHSPP